MPGRGYGGPKPKLEADDSSFDIFLLVVLVVVVGPWVLVLLKKVLWALLGWTRLPLDFACRCKACQANKTKCEKAGRESWLTKGFVVQVTLTLPL